MCYQNQKLVQQNHAISVTVHPHFCYLSPHCLPHHSLALSRIISPAIPSPYPSCVPPLPRYFHHCFSPHLIWLISSHHLISSHLISSHLISDGSQSHWQSVMAVEANGSQQWWQLTTIGGQSKKTAIPRNTGLLTPLKIQWWLIPSWCNMEPEPPNKKSNRTEPNCSIWALTCLSLIPEKDNAWAVTRFAEHQANFFLPLTLQRESDSQRQKNICAQTVKKYSRDAPCPKEGQHQKHPHQQLPNRKHVNALPCGDMWRWSDWNSPRAVSGHRKSDQLPIRSKIHRKTKQHVFKQLVGSVNLKNTLIQ